MKELAEQEIQSSIKVLQEGGMLLFPTDYGWCLGCDATNDIAVTKLRQLLQKPHGDLPVLLAEERDVLHYVAAADLAVFDFVAEQDRPTAIVFDHGLGFAESLPSKAGTVLILLTQLPFCRHLIKRFRAPVVAVPCNLEKTKTLLKSSDSVHKVSNCEINASAFQPSVAGALQIVHWNNGLPVLQAYL